jgi:hypothetical protein
MPPSLKYSSITLSAKGLVDDSKLIQSPSLPFLNQKDNLEFLIKQHENKALVYFIERAKYNNRFELPMPPRVRRVTQAE